jgi:AcrR family transcriptional regulator
MRALAARLGTGTMTVYNYVSDRESLEILVVDAVLAGIVLPLPSSDDWRGDLRGIVVAIWQAVRFHPHAIPLILIRRNQSTVLLQVAEAMLAALARSGRSGYPLLLAFRTITAFVAGFIEADLSGPILAAAGESTASITRRTKKLPQDKYPRLIELATTAASSDPSKEFLDALDELLDCLLSSQ